jgi:hypothetical protein
MITAIPPTGDYVDVAVDFVDNYDIDWVGADVGYTFCDKMVHYCGEGSFVITGLLANLFSSSMLGNPLANSASWRRLARKLQ